MQMESPKFRPNEPEEQKQWQEEIAREFGIKHDAEFFKVPVKKHDGTIEIHNVSKHSGLDPYQMEIKGFKTPITRKEIIEAIMKIYPEMYARGEKPNLTKAVQLLRGQKPT